MVTGPANSPPRPRITTSFYGEAPFYDRADEACASIAAHLPPVEGGPFATRAHADAYRFLGAPAEHLFTRDLLAHFIRALSAWSKDILGTLHVSTPQVRLYTQPCWRAVVRDDVHAEWHYMLSLTRGSTAKVIVLAEELAEDVARGARFSIGRSAVAPARFNELLVHTTARPYGIDAGRPKDASDAALFLDGYLW
jgi:hypothetical protein